MEFPTNIGAVIVAKSIPSGNTYTFVCSGDKIWTCEGIVRGQENLELKAIKSYGITQLPEPEFEVGAVVRARYSTCSPEYFVCIGEDSWVTKRKQATDNSAVVFRTNELAFVGPVLTDEPQNLGAVVMIDGGQVLCRTDNGFYPWSGYDSSIGSTNAWKWSYVSQKSPTLVFEGIHA